MIHCVTGRLDSRIQSGLAYWKRLSRHAQSWNWRGSGNDGKTILKPVGLVRRIPLKAHELISSITAQKDLFVLAHIGIPRVDMALWTLDVGGAVERPFRLTYDDLKMFPTHEVESFHQCAGFPRRPDVATRRVTNVVWSGVQVSDVLAKAGIKRDAQYVLAYGLDCGTFEGNDDQYVKDIPLD